MLHAATAAFVTTSGLSSFNTSTHPPDQSDDELVALQLIDKKENSDFTSYWNFLKINEIE